MKETRNKTGTESKGTLLIYKDLPPVMLCSNGKCYAVQCCGDEVWTGDEVSKYNRKPDKIIKL